MFSPDVPLDDCYFLASVLFGVVMIGLLSFIACCGDEAVLNAAESAHPDVSSDDETVISSASHSSCSSFTTKRDELEKNVLFSSSVHADLFTMSI